MRSDQPDYEITSTVRSKHSVAMSIDMESLGDLFDVLSGLYSDQEMAVLRELCTNARDSHIEASVTRPIEVTLPTDWEPNLIIQDFGLGMDRTEIEDTYSKYGASTKRNSNDYNGTLGLGSKSPLTYTPQFTFIGVKNGVKTTVSVAKSETVPVMKILSELPTDECNGVKVIIPAKSYNKFRDKAKHLFRFWDPETVLINGEKPTPISGLRVTDDIMVTNETDGQDYIVMAGVPYPVDFSHSLVREHALVAYVPTGNVSFVPSREALKYTTKTREEIAAILAEYEREVSNAVQDQIEEAATPSEAFRALGEWRAALGVKTVSKVDYKYKGRIIPVEFAPKDEKITVSEFNSHKLSASSRMSSIAIDTVIHSLCVYGYDLTSFTPSHKKKLLKYVEDKDLKDITHFVLCNTKLPMHWLDRSRVVDWDTIRQIKIPRAGGRTGDPNRVAGSYDLYEQGDYNEGVPGEDIDTTSPIYYFNKTRMEEGYARSHSDLLKAHKRGAWTLVILTNNRVERFKRLFPKAQSSEDELRRIYKRVSNKITDAERIAAAVQDNYWLKRMFADFDISRIDDPAFAQMKALITYDLKESNLRKVTRFRNAGIFIPGVRQEKLEIPEDPFEKYPLVDTSEFCYTSKGSLKRDHVYLYMNAVYAASQANESQES